MINLSAKWQKIIYLPETGMGYQITTVILKDGRQFNQVVIIGGSITHIRGRKDVLFKEEDIEDIIVTHDKWDWSNEDWSKEE